MSYTLNFPREFKSIKCLKEAVLIIVRPASRSEATEGLPLRDRLLKSDLMQMILLGAEEQMVVRTLRVTPERVDYYLAAIGQTFEITIGRSKRQ